jgi:hypothetical protein
MLTNSLKIRPDRQGDLLQQYAARIADIDPNVDCPHDPKEARALLAELEQKQIKPRDTAQDLRLIQLHEVWNALLPQLAKAKRLGVRSRDAISPALPAGGVATPDDLHAMREFAQQLDIDIETFEAKTVEQRAIDKLDARCAEIAKAHNILVRECNKRDDRIAALEAIIGVLKKEAAA